MTKLKYILASVLIVGVFSLQSTQALEEKIEKTPKPIIKKEILDNGTYKKENEITFNNTKISYRLNGSIPEINKFETYKYNFCDTLPNETYLIKDSIKINLITNSENKNITREFELEDKSSSFKLICNNIKPFIKEPSKIEVTYDIEYKGQSTKDLLNYANIEYQDGQTVDDMTTTKIKRIEKDKIDVLTGVMTHQQTTIILSLIFIVLGINILRKARQKE